MRLSNKLIEETIGEVAGSDVIPLVMYLKNKKNVSEFKLAEHLTQEINTTRNMLYRLLKANLVTFNRKKDKQKGWYIYYWTIVPENIKFLYLINFVSNIRHKSLNVINKDFQEKRMVISLYVLILVCV